MGEAGPRRVSPWREGFDTLRWFVRAGGPWRMRPSDLPPWWVVPQQTRRGIEAGCLEAMAAALRAVRRIAAGREPVMPTAVVPGSRTLQSSLESGGRSGYDGSQRREGSQVPAAVDTPGRLPARRVTPADEQDRAQAGALAAAVQAVTGGHVAPAWVDQGSTGEKSAEEAARFRRLARDCERLVACLAGVPWLAVVWLRRRALQFQGAWPALGASLSRSGRRRPSSRSVSQRAGVSGQANDHRVIILRDRGWG